MGTVIYGAGIYGYSLFCALKAQNRMIDAFAVSSLEGNREEIDGVPVKPVAEIEDLSAEVLIAVPEFSRYEIEAGLSALGFYNKQFISSAMWDEVLTDYYRETLEGYKVFSNDAGSVHSKRNSARIYLVTSAFDKPGGSLPDTNGFLWKIQAGASLTTARVADLTDDSGDNISRKNGTFSELTALYHLWKNQNADYKGIFHYRRHLDMKEEAISNLANRNVDAVISTPVLVYPSSSTHHTRYIPEQDWKNMLRCLERLSPEYYEAARKIYSQKRMYLYNICVLRNQVFDKYCSWIFGILFETEKLCDPNHSRKDRYMGYLAENLTSLYFTYNKDRLNVEHARLINIV